VLFILHARLRVRLVPGIPRSLFSLRGTFVSQNPDALRRGNVEACRILLWLILRDGDALRRVQDMRAVENAMMHELAV